MPPKKLKRIDSAQRKLDSFFRQPTESRDDATAGRSDVENEKRKVKINVAIVMRLAKRIETNNETNMLVPESSVPEAASPTSIASLNSPSASTSISTSATENVSIVAVTLTTSAETNTTVTTVDHSVPMLAAISVNVNIETDRECI